MEDKRDSNAAKRGAFLVFDGMALPPFPPLKKNAEERFTAIRDLETRPDDIILTAFPRSGTHWLWEVIHMLLQGNAEYTTAVKETAFLEMIPDLNPINEVKSPRLLNTHVPFRWLPKKHLCDGGKIVHVIRNPKDQAVSMYNFMLSFGPDKAMAGAKMSWNVFFEMIMKAPEKFFSGWFAYEKEFEKASKDGTLKTAHTLYYEDLKMNPTKEIRLLADFLSVDIEDELVQAIADKCTFTKLKKADDTLKTKVIADSVSNYRKVQPLEVVSKQPGESHSKFVRSLKIIGVNWIKKLQTVYPLGLNDNIMGIGEVGDWKNYFTVSQNEQFDSLYKREMLDSELKIKFQI
ncbi:sulfotransferase 1A1-like [Mytilus edulis]|uniref:sulfotransferase 1A1-like n=1 Tax=Mytilus edulis TaxID=6550 RepID=UPI0039F142DB